MAFEYNGSPISIDAPFTAPNGTKYANLRDPSVRQALGVTEVPDPEFYDQRFFWGVGNPKQVEDIEVTPDEGDPYIQKGLKSQWVAQFKDTAGKMLAQTDWMVIRKAERNIDIPESVQSYRAAVIAEADRLEEAMQEVTVVGQLIEVVNSQDWPKGEQ